MPTKIKKTLAAGDVADATPCTNCAHLASAHEDVAAGDNTGACTMKSCACTAMAVDAKPPAPGKAAPTAKAGARRGRFTPAPPIKAEPVPPVPPADPAPDPEPDLPTLLKAVSDAVEAALTSLADVDQSAADPATQTFIALVHAADNCLDLLDGTLNADPDAGDQTQQAETVDACIVAARNCGDGISAPADDVAAAVAAIHDADLASGEVLEALGAPDPDGVDAPDDTDPADVGASDTKPGALSGRRFGRFADAPIITADDVPAETADPAAVTGADGPVFTMPIMVLEGVDTGDGRFITPGCLTWVDLPFPVMGITKTTMGHDDAELVGRIDTVERIDASEMINAKTGEPFGPGVSALRGTGVFTSEAEAERIASLIEGKFFNGVSADIFDVKSTIEFLDASGEPIPDEAADEDEMLFFIDGDIRETLLEGRVAGMTIVPFPAFEGAYIELGDGSTTPQTRADATPEAKELEATVASIFNLDTFGQRDCDECTDGQSLTAAAGPQAPPAEWFVDPGLDGPTPLTITDDGRVFGHLGAWGVCHLGIAGKCVEMPHSKTNYGYYRTGATKCADGSLVSTGPITLGGGHADLPLSLRAAQAHYDESGIAVADVAAGEDRWGVWVAGAMMPNATPDQVRRLRASALSGDWRGVGRGSELVAALAVNTPGFPVVRAQVASGQVTSLVAAGARQVMLAAQTRASTDREMLASMRAQWPMMQSLLAERDARAKVLRASVKGGRLRRDVHKVPARH